MSLSTENSRLKRPPSFLLTAPQHSSTTPWTISAIWFTKVITWHARGMDTNLLRLDTYEGKGGKQEHVRLEYNEHKKNSFCARPFEGRPRCNWISTDKLALPCSTSVAVLKLRIRTTPTCAVDLVSCKEHGTTSIPSLLPGLPAMQFTIEPDRAQMFRCFTDAGSTSLHLPPWHSPRNWHRPCWS